MIRLLVSGRTQTPEHARLLTQIRRCGRCQRLTARSR